MDKVLRKDINEMVGINSYKGIGVASDIEGITPVGDKFLIVEYKNGDSKRFEYNKVNDIYVENNNLEVQGMEQQLNELLDKFAKLNEDKNDAYNGEHYDFILEDIAKTRQKIVDLFKSK